MTAKPITILIAALGGEGGGLLADWLVGAAMASDLPVQSTSIPGVAQRTGATTYYLEIHPGTQAMLGGRRPVMGLYPAPGDIDILVSSELLEAGRAVENGYVTPDQTILIAAAHRVYATIEKMDMEDGRVDASRVLEACRRMAKTPLLFDLTRSSRTRALPLNAVLLGALAGTGRLPVEEPAFEQAIRQRGVAVEPNLAAFRIGLAIGAKGPESDIIPDTGSSPARGSASASLAGAARDFPPAALPVVEEAIRRLVDYQDESYARLYLERLGKVRDYPEAPLLEIARQLALWMAYEDVIRVAQVKSRPERLERVRAEARARADQPVHVTEIFKPGLDEIASVLPRGLGRSLRNWASRKPSRAALHIPVRIRSTGVFGHLLLRFAAGLRGSRPRSLRYIEEQATLETWLALVEQAAAIGADFAFEVARLAKLRKGYGDTWRRGQVNFSAIVAGIVEPALAAKVNAAPQLREAISAAVADPESVELGDVLRPSPARL